MVMFHIVICLIAVLAVALNMVDVSIHVVNQHYGRAFFHAVDVKE